MIFICSDCGAEFDTPSVEREYVGVSPYGKVCYNDHCPDCGSEDFELSKPCAKCGKAILYTDVGYCMDCLEELTAQQLYEYAQPKYDDEEINAFLLSMFAPSEINEILLLKMQAYEDAGLSRRDKENKRGFIEGNVHDIANWLKKENKNGKERI